MMLLLFVLLLLVVLVFLLRPPETLGGGSTKHDKNPFVDTIRRHRDVNFLCWLVALMVLACWRVVGGWGGGALAGPPSTGLLLGRSYLPRAGGHPLKRARARAGEITTCRAGTHSSGRALGLAYLPRALACTDSSGHALGRAYLPRVGRACTQAGTRAGAPIATELRVCCNLDVS